MFEGVGLTSRATGPPEPPRLPPMWPRFYWLRGNGFASEPKWASPGACGRRGLSAASPAFGLRTRDFRSLGSQSREELLSTWCRLLANSAGGPAPPAGGALQKGCGRRRRRRGGKGQVERKQSRVGGDQWPSCALAAAPPPLAAPPSHASLSPAGPPRWRTSFLPLCRVGTSRGCDNPASLPGTLPPGTPRMAGQPEEQGEDISPNLELGSDVGQELKVHPSWPVSWPSFMWSSGALEVTGSGVTHEGTEGKLSSTSLMSPTSLPNRSENLEPRALKLLLAQKELEIQGLQRAAQCEPRKRMTYILDELLGSKAERTSRDQIKALQQQIEKMTQEFRDQKELASQEKTELENQLQEARKTMRVLEDELQAFQRSCLLYLAQTSWAGRVLRSQTGSVEVVTAETLMMDLSDESLNQSSTEAPHFRLEDVDWNSVAQRYPNLFEDIYRKKRPTSPILDSPDSPGPTEEKPAIIKKSVDWSLMPASSLIFTTTTESSSTNHSGSRLSRVTDSSPSLTPPPQEQEGSSGALPDLELRSPKKIVDSSTSLGVTMVGIGLDKQGSTSSSLQDQGGKKAFDSYLKIVKIDKHGKFIRVLNESLQESMDISGFVLKQLIHQFPVCVYRFPKDTLLAPQHHITVWGEGVSLARKRAPQTLQRELIHFYTNPGCVTLLLNSKGQVMSEYQARHSVTEASKSFNDHTDISIDCYPLPEAEREKPSEGPGLGSKGLHRYSRVRKKTKVPGPPRDLEGLLGSHGGRSLNPIPSMNTGKCSNQREVKETVAYRESLHGAIVPLPSISEQAQLPDIGKKMQEKCISRANQFLPPRICRKFVDVDCPMVALSVQKTAESRFGLKHLSYPPITKELREPL